MSEITAPEGINWLLERDGEVIFAYAIERAAHPNWSVVIYDVWGWPVGYDDDVYLFMDAVVTYDGNIEVHGCNAYGPIAEVATQFTEALAGLRHIIALDADPAEVEIYSLTPEPLKQGYAVKRYEAPEEEAPRLPEFTDEERAQAREALDATNAMLRATHGATTSASAPSGIMMMPAGSYEHVRKVVQNDEGGE